MGLIYLRPSGENFLFVVYSVTFFWLEQQRYQQRFHGFERFPIFHQNDRYTIPGGSQPIDLLKSPPEKRHELTSSMSLHVLTSLLSLSNFAAFVRLTTYYR